MSAANYLRRPSTASAVLISALLLSAGAAFGAESYASSMAGGMSDSGASVSSNTSATQQGANQSSGMSTSLSETQRSTGASGYDSALSGNHIPNMVVNNLGKNGAALQNPVITAQSNQIKAGGSNSLIDNAVKQKPADFAPAAGATSSSTLGRANVQTNTNAPITTTTMPHPKVQVWNGR